MKQLLLISLFLFPSYGMDITASNPTFPQTNQAEEWKHQEHLFFDQWVNDPITLYESLQRRRSTNSPFKFPEMSSTVMSIIEDLNQHLTQQNEYELLNTEEVKKLKYLKNQLLESVSNNVPYEDTVSIFYNYLETMDNIFKRLSPTLPNAIAKLLTEDQFENLVKEPSVLLYFSYRSAKIDFFVKTRPAPLYLIGLLKYPNFHEAHTAKYVVDGYETDIGGFAHHDAEHARSSWKTDRALLSNPKRLNEWQRVRDQLYEKIRKLDDIKLGKSIEVLLFEICHERGMQFDLVTLATYLKQPLFSTTSKDKWLNHFWNPLPGPKDLHLRFEEAEKWLYEEVLRLLAEQNREQLLSSKYRETEEQAICCTLPIISMNKGYIYRTNPFIQEDDVLVEINNETGIESVLLSQIKTFGLVNVHPSEQGFVTLANKSHFIQTKYNQLLKLKHQQTKVVYKVIEPGQPIKATFSYLEGNLAWFILESSELKPYDLSSFFI